MTVWNILYLHKASWIGPFQIFLLSTNPWHSTSSSHQLHRSIRLPHSRPLLLDRRLSNNLLKLVLLSLHLCVLLYNKEIIYTL